MRYSRSESLEIWRQVADGLLNEPARLAQTEEPSLEYVRALDFVTEIAKRILATDREGAQERPRKLMQALFLDGKSHPDEAALRSAKGLLDDFGPLRGEGTATTVASLLGSLIENASPVDGRKRSAKGKSTEELNRQLREFRKRKRQDKK
ncbi:MAG: hypothetical protein RL014_1890 [Pseudomonadota bacterium]|jgi:hypothetical protein